MLNWDKFPGDIFYQKITHEEQMGKYSTENCQAVRALEAWENAILKQKDTVIPLVFSEKSNMNHIFKSKKLKRKIHSNNTYYCGALKKLTLTEFNEVKKKKKNEKSFPIKIHFLQSVSQI